MMLKHTMNNTNLSLVSTKAKLVAAIETTALDLTMGLKRSRPLLVTLVDSSSRKKATLLTRALLLSFITIT
jgi:hypothetical protein